MDQKIDNQILISYLNNRLDASQSEEVEAWYWASRKNQNLLEQLYYTLFIGERLYAMNQIDVEASFKELQKQIKSRRPKPYMRILKYSGRIAVAAALVGLLFMAGLFIKEMHDTLSQPFVVVTDLGERTHTILPDGSKVWVAAYSKVEYYNPYPFSKERRVKLEGEAYFEVKKDESHPFIVNSGNQSTRVLGTKFNIRANKGDRYMVTTLIEGRIQLTSPLLAEEGVYMKPNQQFRIDTQTGKSELYDCSYAEEFVSWIDGSLHFRQTTLAEIALDLERYYNVEIIITTDKLKEERFTCDFETSDNIYQIFSILKLTNKFNYKIENRRVTIFEN